MQQLAKDIELELVEYILKNHTLHIELASIMMKKQYFVALFSADSKKAFAYIPVHHQSFVFEDKNGSFKYLNKNYKFTEKSTDTLVISFKIKGEDLQGRGIDKLVVYSDIKPKTDFKHSLFLIEDEMLLDNKKTVFVRDVKNKIYYDGTEELQIFKIKF